MKRTASKQPSASVETVELRIPIQAPQKAVWKALVKETTLWWPKDFYTSARTRGFRLEPKLGGRLFEDSGKGEGLIWYTVVGVESPNWLLLSGYVIPPYGGPATSLLRLTLTPTGPGETDLVVFDSAHGRVGDCDKHEGWRQIFEDGLKRHLEASA